jgi:threonine/homoserine/homoserine lactone efflux protein
MPISAQFDLENCAVGNVCGTLSYVIPSISYMGIINLSGSCCTAPLRLEEIRRSTESQSSATLVLVQESEWTCFQGELTIDAESLDDVYDLTVQSNGGYNVYNSWQWNYGSMSANEGSQATCDGEGIDQNSSNKAIPALVIPVGVTFLVVSCVAVAGGFVGGFFKSPRGMTVKKREYKGCLPKGNAALSRSIIAIVSVDVGVVSTMNLVGALMPVSAMVLVSGILLAIMTYQYEHVGTRFNNKFRRLYQLQQVERVFGRMGAAFLIIIGIFLLLNEIVGIVGGVLGLLSYFFVGVIGWFYLALYITWAFVAVHFAGAIYISVCYYYTAARTDEQESIQDHKMEMDGHNESEP